ncbi:MAG TPA: alanine dehydrogenase [Gammaproteobacteria bacterium]|nr:alanine dehydrogenase [Gammaproteobacteria bacterium]
MLIGIPKEIKKGEFRVGMAPNSVHEVVSQGHKVIVEKGAGEGIECHDTDYETAGAEIVSSAQEIFSNADMIVKVKEPQPIECQWLREEQILFTYLHLAADSELANSLIKTKCIAIAYETVTDARGGLPLLSPMSEVAGRLAIQAGAQALEKMRGGRGVLLGGVPGVEPANVVVLGGGVVGTNAARMAMGQEARVTVLDRSLQRLQELDFQFGSKISTIFATRAAIQQYVLHADLVIGAVLVPGATAPKLLTRSMLSKMHPGSVIVDVAIDQGGCFETSHPTTHDNPTFVLDGVVHYCVTNMPGAVPRTSTFALNNATLPFIITLANKGVKIALNENPNLLNGLNIYKGKVTHPAVAASLGLDYIPPGEALAGNA